MLRFSVFIIFLSHLLCFTITSAGPLDQETVASSSFNSLTKRSTNDDGGSIVEPVACGKNEEYSACSNGGCFQIDCTNLGISLPCRDIIESACIPGCICKPDYLRNASGTCIPTKECPTNDLCTAPNEYYDPCPPSCPQRYCSDKDREATCPPQPKEEDRNCFPRCRCKEGFYYNYNGNCVPYEDCTKFCEGRNEDYVPYPKSCEPQTCDSVNNPDVLQSANTTCSSGCRCFPGFVRNKHGECIAKENCDKCQGPNESFTCKSSCDKVCPTVKATETKCTDHNGFCLDKCFCDEGYARDANNICIPIADCPKEK